MKCIGNWVKNHPNWAWLTGIFAAPLAVFLLGYSVAFLAEGINESWMQPVIDATHIMIFLAPVSVTAWRISIKKDSQRGS
jgi:hypothetical protein